jgi:hypothetical protein
LVSDSFQEPCIFKEQQDKTFKYHWQLWVFLHFADEFLTVWGFAYQKNSEFTYLFDYHLGKMIENGVMNRKVFKIVLDFKTFINIHKFLHRIENQWLNQADKEFWMQGTPEKQP